MCAHYCSSLHELSKSAIRKTRLLYLLFVIISSVLDKSDHFSLSVPLNAPPLLRTNEICAQPERLNSGLKAFLDTPLQRTDVDLIAKLATYPVSALANTS